MGLVSTGWDHPIVYALAPMLFTGPFYAAYLDQGLPGMKNAGHFELGLHEMRNYVVVRQNRRSELTL